MPYNFVAHSFHTKKLCSSFLKRIAILHRNRPFCVFSRLFFGGGGLEPTYDDHLRLILGRYGSFRLADERGVCR